MIYLSLFDNLVGLALKGLGFMIYIITMVITDTYPFFGFLRPDIFP